MLVSFQQNKNINKKDTGKKKEEIITKRKGKSKMTYTELRRLLIDADECNTLEQFLAETGGSLDAEFYESENAAYNLLADIWKLHENYTYRTLVEISGTSNRQIAIRYNIPIRTVENWHAESHEITPYLLNLLASDIITEKYRQML